MRRPLRSARARASGPPTPCSAIKAEMPENNNDAVLSDIYKVLFVYDPGKGINEPD